MNNLTKRINERLSKMIDLKSIEPEQQKLLAEIAEEVGSAPNFPVAWRDFCSRVDDECDFNSVTFVIEEYAKTNDMMYDGGWILSSDEMDELGDDLSRFLSWSVTGEWSGYTNDNFCGTYDECCEYVRDNWTTQEEAEEAGVELVLLTLSEAFCNEVVSDMSEIYNAE